MSILGGALEGLGAVLVDHGQKETQFERDTKRRQLEEELKKKYEGQIIDPSQTRIEGNQEIRYNKYGEKISTRTLSPEEAEARQLELEEKRTKTQRAKAETASAEAEAKYKPRVFESTLESQAASRDASRASAENARGRLSLDQKQYDDRISQAQQDRVNEAEQLIYAVGNNGDASAAQKAELLSAKLTAAKSSGDTAEINRVLNQVVGELGLLMKRAETDATNKDRIGTNPAGANPVLQLDPNY